MNANLFKNLPFLMLPPLFWAGNFVVGKLIHQNIPPFTLALGRWILALLLISPFAWQFVQRDWALYRVNWRNIVVTALLGVVAFTTLTYKGLHDTSTTNALLLNSCIPVLIMLIGAVFYQQKLRHNQIMGLIISLLGVAIIILAGDLRRLLALSFNLGDLWVFLAMVCWAFYTLVTKNIPNEINKIGLLIIQIIVGIAVLLPLCLWEYFSGQIIVFNQKTILSWLYIGIFPSVAAYLLYSFAVTRVGAVRAGLSIHLIPVFGVALAVGFLGEIFQIYHVIGIILIAVGLILSNRVK